MFIQPKKNPKIRVSKVMELSQILEMQPQFANTKTVPLQISPPPLIEVVLLSINVLRQDKCISPGPTFSEQTMVGWAD